MQSIYTGDGNDDGVVVEVDPFDAQCQLSRYLTYGISSSAR
jgi:hypothetical protein